MSAAGWVFVGVTSAVLLVIGGMTYLAVVLAWEEQRTRGAAYYGKPLAERQRFRRQLRAHARILRPVVRLSARLTKVDLERASFRHAGIAGPKGSCSEESFRAGLAYSPRPEDVFVVTQMKCGTTWMQHLVYQVLTRGEGALAERGEALYGIAPWLEGVKSVSIADAPLIGGERPSRIIKTHFPADLCPYDERAKYVYVVRHPVSCFASCVDFIRANLGAFAPDLDAMRGWFCSDEAMWWGSWPRHVEGWWKLSRSRGNVLFVQFEEMKRDLTGVTRRLVRFLEVAPLSDEEIRRVVEKCGFEYMRQHDASFEMQPPHLLAIDAELLVKGTADRYRDVPNDVRRSVFDWCRERLEGSEYPLAQQYPPS